MVAFLILIGLVLVDILIIIAVKYKEEIWYIIYQRMGWLEDNKKRGDKNGRKR
jgi:hypothetical protein